MRRHFAMAAMFQRLRENYDAHDQKIRSRERLHPVARNADQDPGAENPAEDPKSERHGKTDAGDAECPASCHLHLAGNLKHRNSNRRQNQCTGNNNQSDSGSQPESCRYRTARLQMLVLRVVPGHKARYGSPHAQIQESHIGNHGVDKSPDSIRHISEAMNDERR